MGKGTSVSKGRQDTAALLRGHMEGITETLTNLPVNIKVMAAAIAYSGSAASVDVRATRNAIRSAVHRLEAIDSILSLHEGERVRVNE